MREMRVVAIGMDPRAGSPVLLLQEAAAQRRVLPVWVGPAEANAIELERRLIPTHRPLTHQLICQVIGSCGRRLERVCVTSLHEGTFHAELVISPDVRVSARVSDAVAMALHQGVSIHAADAVLEEAAVPDVQVSMPASTKVTTRRRGRSMRVLNWNGCDGSSTRQTRRISTPADLPVRQVSMAGRGVAFFV